MAEAKPSKNKSKYGSIIHKCSCRGTEPSKFQDMQYGPGMRVFNLCKLGENARCTCCGHEIDAKSGSNVKTGSTDKAKVIAIINKHSKFNKGVIGAK